MKVHQSLFQTLLIQPVSPPPFSIISWYEATKMQIWSFKWTPSQLHLLHYIMETTWSSIKTTLCKHKGRQRHSLFMINDFLPIVSWLQLRIIQSSSNLLVNKETLKATQCYSFAKVMSYLVVPLSVEVRCCQLNLTLMFFRYSRFWLFWIVFRCYGF